MAELVFPAPAPVLLPVAGGGFFPVRRVYCVGRNYAEHVKEMGNDLRDPPFFFEKPADAVVSGGADIAYPPETADFHHEIELVVAIGRDGETIAEDAALEHVFGYAAGLDMTRRDLQALAKKAGRPWTFAKGFDQSAPIGEIAPASRIGHPATGAVSLSSMAASGSAGTFPSRSGACRGHRLSQPLCGAEGGRPHHDRHAGRRGAVERGDVLEGSIAGVGTVRTTII